MANELEQLRLEAEQLKNQIRVSVRHLYFTLFLSVDKKLSYQ